MPYRFLDHTADIRIECEAAGFDGLLAEAAHGFYATALSRQEDGCGEQRTFVVSEQKVEDRLIRFLQELIFLLETERFVGVRFAFNEPDDGALMIFAQGYRCGEDDRSVEVKSATYHDLEVKESDSGWVARFVLDV